MAIQNCHECGTGVSSQAKLCPQCGAPVKPSSSAQSAKAVVQFVFLIGCVWLLAQVFGGGAVSENEGGASAAVNGRATFDAPSVSSHRPPPAPEQPKLILLNWSWHEEHGYAIVEGEVRNNSSENLRNVEVVVKFYTAGEKFITFDGALIEYNPILPGQTSPFKAMATHNPAMRTARISFKELMGGTIPWKKKE